MSQTIQLIKRGSIMPLVIGATVLATLLWAYWPTLANMAQVWENDPQYSHGFLVPIFSLFLLWSRRKEIQFANMKCNVWGIALLCAAVSMRIVGTYFHYEWLDPISLLPTIGGAVVLFGGWRALQYTWPAIAFLFFMIPLPYNLSIKLAGPLQFVATEASTFFLQVMGYPAVAEGNVILLNDFELGVVEACSGLRMLMVFFALATAVAMFLKKPLWEKALIVATALPIAVVANIMRITFTGLMYELAGKEITDGFVHDAAGWLMMPLALALLAGELFLINRIIVANPTTTQPGNTPEGPKIIQHKIWNNRGGRMSQLDNKPTGAAL